MNRSNINVGNLHKLQTRHHREFNFPTHSYQASVCLLDITYTYTSSPADVSGPAMPKNETQIRFDNQKWQSTDSRSVYINIEVYIGFYERAFSNCTKLQQSYDFCEVYSRVFRKTWRAYCAIIQRGPQMITIFSLQHIHQTPRKTDRHKSDIRNFLLHTYFAFPLRFIVTVLLFLI